MKPSNRVLSRIALTILLAWPAVDATAQGYDTPLTLQGLNHQPVASVASRGTGGTSIVIVGDVGQMFAHPAFLTTLEKPQVAFSASRRSLYQTQDQRYGGLQGFSAFTPLMEGTTWKLSDPDTSKPGVTARSSWNQADSVQRPFDDFGPAWNRNNSKVAPVQVFAAFPFEIEGIKVVAAAGFVEYANLNWYYQNNNCLSPSVLSVLNGTVRTNTLPSGDPAAIGATQPYLAQWYQYWQQRDGSIYGYGGSLAVQPLKNLSVGVSFMILQGSTDDREVQTGRGRMVFFSSSLRLDKMGMTSYDKTGTSDFSGSEAGVSLAYTGKFINAGVAVKLPTTITRKYSYTISKDSVTNVRYGLGRSDSLHALSTLSVSGEDKLQLPLRGSAAFAFKIREKLTLGIDYELRATESAVYTGANGLESNPWNATTILHVGAEYRPFSWMALRAGVTDYQEVTEPLSHALRGDAIDFPIYALGLGFTFEGVSLDVVYEYSDMKLIDTWSNAASINRTIGNTVSVSASYDLPVSFGE